MKTKDRESDLKPGQKLNQPEPLFKKLEEKLVEEERARLGKQAYMTHPEFNLPGL